MNHASPPTIPELIDLEHRLESDRDLTRAELVRRDADIGRKIDAPALGGIALYRAWLREVRGPARPSPGSQVDRLRQWVTSLLVIGGLILGLGAVSGWLSMASGRPINVIHLWAVMVGLQLLLLLGWIMVIMPEKWHGRIPGFETLRMAIRADPVLAPAAPHANLRGLVQHRRGARVRHDGDAGRAHARRDALKIDGEGRQGPTSKLDRSTRGKLNDCFDRFRKRRDPLTIEHAREELAKIIEKVISAPC